MTTYVLQSLKLKDGNAGGTGKEWRAKFLVTKNEETCIVALTIPYRDFDHPNIDPNIQVLEACLSRLQRLTS